MITYQILENTIIILNNNIPYLINKDDERFNVILNNLNNLKEEHFLPNTKLPKGFSYRDNVLYFNKFQIPSRIEKILMNSENKESFLNFWLNLVTRFSFDEILIVFKQIELGNLYPILSNGFVIFYRFPIDDSMIHEKLVKNFIITKISEHLESNLEFDSSFWKKTEFVNSLMTLIKNNPKIEITYLKVLSMLLKNETLDEVVYFLKNPPLIEHKEIVSESFYSLVTNFLQNKTNSFNKNRFLNLIQHPLFLDLKAKYSFVIKEDIEINLKDTTVESAYEIIDREFKRIEKEGRNLKIHNNYPYTKEIDNKKIDEINIVFPKTSKDLVKWGSILHNCVGNGSYASDCISGRTYILGLFFKNKIIASVEVLNHQIVQFEFEKNVSFLNETYLKKAVQNEIDNALKNS